MDLGLSGKTALVTGGSRGIGYRIADRLAEEGCHLGICGRDSTSLDEAAARLTRRGVKVIGIRADVSLEDEAVHLVKEMGRFFGAIDILINNVGGAVGSPVLLETSNADWQKTFELNVFQVARMIRLVVPLMNKKEGGSIVNIASISGWQPQLSGSTQYGASKAALIFMTERLALEFARHRIRINCLSPGSIIWKDGGWDHYKKTNPSAFDRYVKEGFPWGRLGSPEEVANVAAFLASPGSEWINGRHIPVDGLEQPYPAEIHKLW